MSDSGIPDDDRRCERREVEPKIGKHGLVSASIEIEHDGPQLEAAVTRDPITNGEWVEFVGIDVKGGGVEFSFSLDPADARDFAEELLEAVDETIPENSDE